SSCSRNRREVSLALPFSDASLQPPQFSSSGCSSPPCKFCQNPPVWHPGYHKHTPDSGPPQLWLSCGRTSGARATSRSSRTVRARFLREHAAVLLHKPELTRGSQRPYRRLSGHWPQSAFEEVSLSQCPRAVSVLAPSEGHLPVSGTPQEPAIGAVVVRAPRLETSLLVELVRKGDVVPAVKQIPQVQSNPRQVHRVDLEIAPVQSPVGIVVVDLASSLRILGPLDG